MLRPKTLKITTKQIAPAHSAALGSQQGTWRTGRGHGVPDPMTLLNLQLCSSVVSAMRTIVAPVVPAAPGSGDAGDVVMVPLLVFHGADHVDGIGLDEASAMEDLVNVTQVSRVLNAMSLPGQEVVVVSATHSLSEHPQVGKNNRRTPTADRRHKIYFGRAIVRDRMRHPPIQSLFRLAVNTRAIPFYRELVILVFHGVSHEVTGAMPTLLQASFTYFPAHPWKISLLIRYTQVAVALEKSFATKRVSEVKPGRGMFHRNREVRIIRT